MTKWVELRRHSFTKHGDGRGTGSHLSAEGVSAARAEGHCIGPLDYVAVSTVPRTMETALAMGFAVDAVVDLEPPMVTGVIDFHEWLEWAHPFAVFAARARDDQRVAGYLARQATLVRDTLAQCKDDQTALIVGHGGWLEATVVACAGNRDLENRGSAFRHLEGARLVLDDDEDLALVRFSRR